MAGGSCPGTRDGSPGTCSRVFPSFTDKFDAHRCAAGSCWCESVLLIPRAFVLSEAFFAVSCSERLSCVKVELRELGEEARQSPPWLQPQERSWLLF